MPVKIWRGACLFPGRWLSKKKVIMKSCNYTKLADVLPLSTPLMVMIDVSNLCNFRCIFCPTGDPQLLESFNRPKGVMELELFSKIVDDLSKFNKKLKVLYLYKDGEPFLNRNLGKMIAYAKSKEITDSVETTSNGSLIDRSRAIEIIEAGLDKIRISVEHVNDSDYKKLTGTYSNYESIRKNVEFLFREKTKRGSALLVQVKILDTGLSAKDKGRFMNDFSSISDSINIDTLMGWSLSKEKDFTLGIKVDTAEDGQTPLKKNRKVCPRPFYTMAINFNGLVSVCCTDWSWGTIIGDVRKEELLDIWLGKKMKEFRLLHLRNERSKIQACADCHYLWGVNEESDIDNYSEELLAKFDN